jgi:hypothetical protein
VLDLWKLPEGAVYDNTYFFRVFEQLVKHGDSGSHWEWKAREQIDDATKVVNVQLEASKK